MTHHEITDYRILWIQCGSGVQMFRWSRATSLPKSRSTRRDRFARIASQLTRTFSMAPRTCVLCEKAKAMLKRPKTGQQICRDCFFYIFETEVHNTITQSNFFNPGDRVAIGASGGKGTRDSPFFHSTRLCGIYFGVSDVGRFDCPCICYENA
jgi:hypothetical protein